jgi:hypothetical protein
LKYTTPQPVSAVEPTGSEMRGMMVSDDGEEFEPPEFHRNQDLDHTGTSQVIIERFLKYRLPMLLEIKAEMDEGKILTTGELELLTRMLSRAMQISRFVHDHPEYAELAGKIISLIHEMTEEALQNETDGG